MDKEVAQTQAKDAYEENLRKIEVAEKVCKKVESLLPEEWSSGYDVTYGTLSFKRSSEGHASQFRVVCGLVEKASGINLSRHAGGNKHYQYLYGSGYLFWGKGHCYCLRISVELGKPKGCKIELKRSWTVTPEVDDACLGIRKPKEVTK